MRATCQQLRWWSRTSCRSPFSTCPSPSRTLFFLAQYPIGSSANSASSPILIFKAGPPLHRSSSGLPHSTITMAQDASLAPRQKVEHLITHNPLVIFSKTYCPYSRRVKDLFRQLGAAGVVVELDQEPDGPSIQRALAAMTGQPTVPHVFIGGKEIGGADSTLALYAEGKLVPMLEAVGALKGDEPSKI